MSKRLTPQLNTRDCYPLGDRPHLTFKLVKGGYHCSRHPVLVMQSLPFQQLQVLLTLFSESFSSFPCGTCFLSVSHRVFSLRWSIPPNSGCTLKQPDSETADPLWIQSTRPSPFVVGPNLRESHPLCFTPFHVTWGRWTVLDLGRVFIGYNS